MYWEKSWTDRYFFTSSDAETVGLEEALEVCGNYSGVCLQTPVLFLCYLDSATDICYNYVGYLPPYSCERKLRNSFVDVMATSVGTMSLAVQEIHHHQNSDMPVSSANAETLLFTFLFLSSAILQGIHAREARRQRAALAQELAASESGVVDMDGVEIRELQKQQEATGQRPSQPIDNAEVLVPGERNVGFTKAVEVEPHTPMSADGDPSGDKLSLRSFSDGQVSPTEPEGVSLALRELQQRNDQLRKMVLAMEEALEVLSDSRFLFAKS